MDDDVSLFVLPSGKRLKELKITELRSELSQRRQSTLGKKADLVERLYNFEKSSIEAENMETNDKDEESAAEKMEEEDITQTPQKKFDIFEEGVCSIRKSSRSERYEKRQEEQIEESEYLSEDENTNSPKTPEHRNTRRSSAIRRSVLRMLDIKDDEYGNKLFKQDNFITPDKDEKEEKRSREGTVDLSPSRSKLRESVGTYLAQPNDFGTPKKRTDNNPQIAFGSSLANPASAKVAIEPSSSLRSGAITNRFAAQHKKLMEKQENLADRRARIRQLHENLTNGASSTVKRLATPKSAASSSRLPVKVETENKNAGFVFNNIELANFQFGDIPVSDYSRITKRVPDNSQTRAMPVRALSAQPSRMDAKEMSKKARTLPRKLTRIDEGTFTEYISTPKGKRPSKIPIRSSYQPHRGNMKKYIDTTKLSDRELELAKESGILSGSTRIPEQIQKNKRKRDEILNIRRKLNL